MEPIILFESRFLNINLEQPAIGLEERGLQFGDGIYEVVRLYKGSYHLLEPHIDRLYRSMNAIQLSAPFTKGELIAWLHELVERNGLQEDGIVYLQISRGVQTRNHIFAANTSPTWYAYLVKKERPLAWLENGIHACLEEDIRWLRCDIKSLNLLPNVLAKASADRKGCAEALFVRNGNVTEGSHSNFFLVKNGTIITHPANNLILNGIVRQHILALAAKLRIPLQEELFTPKDIREADECFFTGTTTEVLPMTHLDESPIGTGMPGPITRQLQKAFHESILYVQNL
ncbi:D-amino-acid transaminase [Bacillus sp. 165]|uniref:D-amino-acid transaminase n=1 Tax=Bacillus sp. 165 TaxID=1529117 RepID=UPI001ADC5A03|nr:D-amino-acid transaminase [Bacillus sp. 165]MBO9129974.1 D-amino-acid transaminase [Bacillus sp. 165]